MEIRTYRYRLYPGRCQKIVLLNHFKACKSMYNALLSESKNAKRLGRKILYSQVRCIKESCSEYVNVHSQVLQNVADRLHKSFRNFFRRLKEKRLGKNAKLGYPRFKGKVMSITYPQSGFKLVNSSRIFVSKIGSIPIILHRIPKGKIKTMAVKQNKAGQWFAIFACNIDIPAAKHPHKDKAVGIDVGLANFATLSNGTSIPNPRNLSNAEKKLKKLQRRLSRKKKGSANRRKAICKLARQHNKVANRRIDFLHKLSKSLALQYGTIAVESLNIKGMVQNHCLAKHIHDASWGNFIRMLRYKAVTGGGTFAENPNTRGSSRRCSNCGNEEDMPLGKKQFVCSKCGLSLHRDVNASRNHLKDTVGLTGINTPVDRTATTPSSEEASRLVEAGTIFRDKA